jgi:23S rRNA (uracil1939-C5)-methyltransferase
MTLKNTKSIVCTIDSLGHMGDGLARVEDSTLAVPFTLSGEVVRVDCLQSAKRGECTLQEIIQPSPLRVPAPCQHFTRCGGCQLQHLSLSTYAAFKKDRVLSALKGQGLEGVTVCEPMILPRGSRRRAAFKALKRNNQVKVGFYRRASHHIIDIKECPLVLDSIRAFVPHLRQFLESFLSNNQALDVFVLCSDVGLDVLFDSPHAPKLELDERLKLTRFAEQANLARLSLSCDQKDKTGQEIIVSFRTPVVHFDGVPVQVEAKNFLQVSKSMDDFLAHTVDHTFAPSLKRGADLFSGRGTLTLPLSRRARVDAFELDEQALSALQTAANRHQRPIQTSMRNLFQNPLKVNELNQYDCVCINPPRIGAVAQVKMLAESSVPDILMISCNPISFAKDVRALLAGGYKTDAITPVDQFLWSPHVEMVAHFYR